MEIDEIFDNLGKKPKKVTTTKVKTVIPQELEGLGIEGLLDELDAALNGKAPAITNKETAPK